MGISHRVEHLYAPGLIVQYNIDMDLPSTIEVQVLNFKFDVFAEVLASDKTPACSNTKCKNSL